MYIEQQNCCHEVGELWYHKISIDKSKIITNKNFFSISSNTKHKLRFLLTLRKVVVNKYQEWEAYIHKTIIFVLVNNIKNLFLISLVRYIKLALRLLHQVDTGLNLLRHELNCWILYLFWFFCWLSSDCHQEEQSEKVLAQCWRWGDCGVWRSIWSEGVQLVSLSWLELCWF